MKIIAKFVVGVGLWAASIVAMAEVPDALNPIIPVIESWGENPVIVAAVIAQNEKNVSLNEIKELDAQWQAASDLTPFMRDLMQNEAARELVTLEQSQPYFLEVFVMDNQGALVALTNKTSDYWQGDEAKWQKSFNNGNAAVHISDVEFDDSAAANLVQVSVAVKSEGKVIGALTVGVNVDEL